jgi:hypothetical protein
VTPSITEAAVYDALGNFVLTVLGLPTSQVIIGLTNRVASPEGDYVVMWPLRRPRLSTNVDSSADCKFTGSISGTVMTVTDVAIGAINNGAIVFGVGVANNTTITGPVTVNPDGTGIYQITPSQTVGSATLSAGQNIIEQSTEFVMQCDMHGTNSGDNAQTISTAFRDEYGVRLFAGTGVSPLYSDDPRQLAFTTAADQFDERWSIDMHMQFDPSIAVPQEYYDSSNVTTVNVDAAFPA